MLLPPVRNFWLPCLENPKISFPQLSLASSNSSQFLHCPLWRTFFIVFICSPHLSLLSSIFDPHRSDLWFLTPVKSLLSCSNMFQLVAKILAFCAPMPNRNVEKVLEERDRVALFICQAKREHSRLEPQELCLLHWGISEKWKSHSSVQIFGTPWTICSMEFSKPEYWSGFSSVQFSRLVVSDCLQPHEP